MRFYTTEFKVGVFTLIAVGALVYILWMLKSQFFADRQDAYYHTLTANARGVVSLTNVRTSGVAVGYVSGVEIQGDLTKIRFQIDRSIKIPVGSRAQLRTRGLLGEAFLEIIRAPDSGEYISEEGMIPMSPGYVDFTDFIGIMGQVVEDVKKLTGALSEAVDLGDKGKENRIVSLSQSVEDTLREMRSLVADNRRNVEASVQNIAQISENIARYTREDPFAGIKLAADKLSHSLDSVQEIAHSVTSGQGTVGRLIQDDTLYMEVQEVAMGVKTLLTPAQKLRIQIRYNNELRVDQSTQHFFSTQLQFRPERFYILGLTQYPASSEESVITTQETMEGERVITRRETVIESKEPSLRVSAQFGHRWQNFALRFGLFESTAGWAADYHLLEDRVRLSFENYDWGNSEERSLARFKLYGFWYVFPQVYATFGVSDLTRRATDGSAWLAMRPFLGAGFYFNDDDLKRIVGLASMAF